MAVKEEISDPEEKTDGRRYSSFISFGNAMVIFAKKMSLLLHFYFDTVPLFLKLSFDSLYWLIPNTYSFIIFAEKSSENSALVSR